MFLVYLYLAICWERCETLFCKINHVFFIPDSIFHCLIRSAGLIPDKGNAKV